jgi:iron complex outermembrane recepter protein
MKNTIITAALVSCCLAALSAPQLAAAQAAAPSAAEGGDDSLNPNAMDIVVTAARDQRLLKDVPMSVNVASGEQLEKLNLFDAKDIQRLAPGLEMTNTTGRSNTTTLRGVTFDPDQGTGPAVQVYMNEVPTDAQFAYTALYDIQQIEVLRGAQGLLRGLSAPAGAITIATRRPIFDGVEGYAQATGTSRAGYNVQGGVSLPFSDKVAIRVAGLVDGNRLNNVTNVTRGERSRSRTESARITLGLRPSDKFSAYLTYQYLHADNRQFQQVIGPGATPIREVGLPVTTLDLGGGFVVPLYIFLPSPDGRRSGPAATVEDRIAVSQGTQRFLNNSHFVSVTADWDLGPATVSAVGGYQFAELKQFRDSDLANAIVDQAGGSHLVTIPNKIWSGELRVQSNNAGEGFRWGASAFYSKRTGTVTASSDATTYGGAVPLSQGLFLPITADAIVPVNSETISFSGNLSYRTGPLRLEAGLRYSILRSVQTATINITSPGGVTLVPVGGGAFLGIPVSSAQINQSQIGIPAALQRIESHPLTGGVNASLEISPDITAYASYGRSFRGGSSGVAVPVGISDDLIQSRSEKTDSYEIGLKGTVLDRRLNFALAAFYQKFDGFLSRFTSIPYNCPEINGVCSTAGPPINNAIEVANSGFDFNYNGDATVKGVEVSLFGRVTRNWDLGVNMSYVKARYDDARVPCNDFAGTGVPNAPPPGVPNRITGTGNVSYCQTSGRLADVPDFNLSATTELRVPLGNVTPFIRGLLTYRPSVYSEQSAYQLPSRTLLDLFVGVRDAAGKWEFNVFARNLLDQQRITSISSGTAIMPTGSGTGLNSGYRIINATNPREFGATLRHSW